MGKKKKKNQVLKHVKHHVTGPEFVLNKGIKVIKSKKHKKKLRQKEKHELKKYYQ